MIKIIATKASAVPIIASVSPDAVWFSSPTVTTVARSVKTEDLWFVPFAYNNVPMPVKADDTWFNTFSYYNIQLPTLPETVLFSVPLVTQIPSVTTDDTWFISVTSITITAQVSDTASEYTAYQVWRAGMIGVPDSLSSYTGILTNVNPVLENRAYFAGGVYGTNTVSNKITSISFTDDSLTEETAVLSGIREYTSGTFSKSKGYYAGGYTGSSYVTAIDSLSYISKTVSALSAVLSVARSSIAAVLYRTQCCYYASGSTTTKLDKLIFSTEAVASISFTLTTPREYASGLYSPSKGYVAGGDSGSSNLTTVESINFADDTTMVLYTALVNPPTQPAVLNSDSDGYLIGGHSGSYLNTYSYISFTDDSFNQSGVGLSVARDGTGSANVLTSGYIVGGYTGSDSSIADKFVFSSGIASAISATLGQARRGISGSVHDITTHAPSNIISTGTKGYFCGGSNVWSGSVFYGTIDGISYDNGVSYASSAGLTSGLNNTAGVYTTTNGYIMGGSTGSVQKRIDSFAMATEVRGALSATLGTARYAMAGVSSLTDGYACGGSTGSYNQLKTIDDLNFTTLTDTVLSATLVTARYAPCGVFDRSRGYIAGYYTAGTSIEYLDYGTVTCGNTSGVLSIGRDNIGNLGPMTNTTGYFPGGMLGAAGAEYSVVDYYNFGASSGTLLAVLGSNVAQMCNVSGPVKAYMAGGEDFYITLALSSMRGLDFYSTTVYNHSYTLSQARTSSIALSSYDSYTYSNTPSNYPANSVGIGYVCGGGIANASTPMSSIEGLNYVNESTFVANVVHLAASLSTTLLGGCGYSSSTTGYISNGWSSGSLNRNTIDLLDFGSETVTQMAIGILYSSAKAAAITSYNRGYECGGGTAYGTDSTGVNVISGVVYDTHTTFLNGAVLTVIRDCNSGLGTENYGYICGGTSASGVIVATIDKLTFSTGAVAALGATLSAARYLIGDKGLMSANNGYISGGITTGSVYVSSMDQISYGTDTASAAKTSLTIHKAGHGTNSASIKGYMSGGLLSALTALTDYFSFYNYTTGGSYATLNTARCNMATVSSYNPIEYTGSETYPAQVYDDFTQNYTNDANTLLLLYCNDFTDSSSYGKTATLVSNTGTVSPGGGKLNVGLTFSGAYLNYVNTAYNIGYSDFTIDFWIYPTGSVGGSGILSTRQLGSGASGISIAMTNLTITAMLATNNSSQTTSFSYLCTANTWTHITVMRKANNGYFFVNGSNLGAVQAWSWNCTLTALSIGNAWGSTLTSSIKTGAMTNCVLDMIRFSNIARY